ncbi:regulator of G protein signaling superfamily [Saccharata proteae CBS 121410]|uniref:Regulator of G protein signaling superfamily n=1 Tax=Saccharata proteae CBS 121410 TaxID=1314787 RepID=A0A9P4HSK7_9PEZI|nr:regulator of G protein signaling superfamily [Saccharata proteae CBS 121410]
MPARPLTVAIPRGYSSAQGPYCPRRPNLAEILANTAPPPWTLSAFMAYLSQNHCLETLEFTMDASRYRKHYNSKVEEDCQYVKMLWQRLLDAYIAPNGPREVNLPSDVRDSLLELSHPYDPPHPSVLDTAVKKIYELMEESVLVPFLNSLSPQSANGDSACNSSEENLHSHTRSYDERAFRRVTSANPSASSPSGGHRASAPSSLSTFSHVTRNFGAAAHAHFARPSHRSSGHHGPASQYAVASPVSSAGAPEPLTDDSASASSPHDDPMTPPTTPPMSDYGYTTGGPGSASTSPRNSRADRSDSGWKRMSSMLGWKKKSNGQIRDHELEGAPF